MCNDSPVVWIPGVKTNAGAARNVTRLGHGTWGFFVNVQAIQFLSQKSYGLLLVVAGYKWDSTF